LPALGALTVVVERGFEERRYDFRFGRQCFFSRLLSQAHGKNKCGQNTKYKSHVKWVLQYSKSRGRDSSLS
jgi:hypothetical protein